MIKPNDPLRGGIFNFVDILPGAALTNDLDLVQAVDGFSQCVVVRIANAADRRLDPGLGQPFGVVNQQVLTAAVM